MQVTIKVEKTILSDQSEVFDVVIQQGNSKIRLAARDPLDADHIAAVIQDAMQESLEDVQY
jgi:hypothetical protein